MHKNVFDFYPSISPEGENQIKNILKYCLKLPPGLGVNFRQYFKRAFCYTHFDHIQKHNKEYFITFVFTN